MEWSFLSDQTCDHRLTVIMTDGWHLLSGMLGLAAKWVRLDPKLDKSGTFSDQIQYILAQCAKMYWIWSENFPDLSHLGPIWPTLGPNLVTVIWAACVLFQCGWRPCTESVPRLPRPAGAALSWWRHVADSWPGRRTCGTREAIFPQNKVRWYYSPFINWWSQKISYISGSTKPNAFIFWPLLNFHNSLYKTFYMIIITLWLINYYNRQLTFYNGLQ